MVQVVVQINGTSCCTDLNTYVEKMFSQLKNNSESKFSFNLKANIFIPKKSYRKSRMNLIQMNSQMLMILFLLTTIFHVFRMTMRIINFDIKSRSENFCAIKRKNE